MQTTTPTLYFSPFACSLASHLAIVEAELPIVLRRAELRSKRCEDGHSLYDYNPLGQVPTLVLGEGSVLTENLAILVWLAEQAPPGRLAPSEGGMARIELLRWLALLGTEVHKKVLAMIFHPAAPEPAREFARAEASKPLGVLDERLRERPWLLGDDFSVADAYLIWALNLLPHAGIPRETWPSLVAYFARALERPAVRRVFEVERRAHATPFALA